MDGCKSTKRLGDAGVWNSVLELKVSRSSVPPHKKKAEQPESHSAQYDSKPMRF